MRRLLCWLIHGKFNAFTDSLCWFANWKKLGSCKGSKPIWASSNVPRWARILAKIIGKAINLWNDPQGIKPGQQELMEMYTAANKAVSCSARQRFSAELQGFKVPFVPSQASQTCTVQNHNHVFPLMPISPMVPNHKPTHFLWGELRLLRNFGKRVKHA